MQRESADLVRSLGAIHSIDYSQEDFTRGAVRYDVILDAVGTHPDHRRRGLGKAVVLHAMHHMKAAGMTHATVANSGASQASHELRDLRVHAAVSVR